MCTSTNTENPEMNSTFKEVDPRRNPDFMEFWDAINRTRRSRGEVEALYGNVRHLWDQALIPTKNETQMAALRAA